MKELDSITYKTPLCSVVNVETEGVLCSSIEHYEETVYDWGAAASSSATVELYE